jgi:hypothetical protein
MWQAFTQIDKTYWDQLVISKGLQMSGYNYFLSQYLTTRGFGTYLPIQDQLKTWWKFDETSGLIAYDSKGTANLTLLNTSWVPGHTNNGLSFNGNNSKASTPNQSYFSTYPFSLEFWIKIPVLPSILGHSYFILFHRRSANVPGTYQIYIPIATNKINCFVWNTSTGGGGISANNAMVIDTWYHVVITASDVRRYKMYINTIKQTAELTAPLNWPGNMSFYVGSYNLGSYFLSGILDNVRVYSKALSQDEITHNYNLG